ncbi:MAG: class II aldolase/adducin family protein [Anaerolineae bacterium]|nr:class II aldolase/adducin family protein [Anaerolineae bacterium]MCA9909904.1 class II aldolase/adducin family protein [Anaerolineae bacterium]
MNAVIPDTLKAELAAGATKVAKIGLMPLTQGNLSLRDPSSGLILVTPHDYDYDGMTPDDIVVVDIDGNIIAGKHEPSAETQVHLAVYERRPEVFGIVHAEPVYTNVFGVLHKPIAPVHVGMAIDVGGECPVMPFEHSGSREFGYHMLEYMGNKNAVIWANHGMLSVGPTLRKAIHCAVLLEMTAKIYHAALQIGTPVSLSDDIIEFLIG